MSTIIETLLGSNEPAVRFKALVVRGRSDPVTLNAARQQIRNSPRATALLEAKRLPDGGFPARKGITGWRRSQPQAARWSTGAAPASGGLMNSSPWRRWLC